MGEEQYSDVRATCLRIAPASAPSTAASATPPSREPSISTAPSVTSTRSAQLACSATSWTKQANGKLQIDQTPCRALHGQVHTAALHSPRCRGSAAVYPRPPRMEEAPAAHRGRRLAAVGQPKLRPPPVPLLPHSRLPAPAPAPVTPPPPPPVVAAAAQQRVGRWRPCGRTSCETRRTTLLRRRQGLQQQQQQQRRQRRRQRQWQRISGCLGALATPNRVSSPISANASSSLRVLR